MLLLIYCELPDSSISSFHSVFLLFDPFLNCECRKPNITECFLDFKPNYFFCRHKITMNPVITLAARVRHKPVIAEPHVFVRVLDKFNIVKWMQ